MRRKWPGMENFDDAEESGTRGWDLAVAPGRPLLLFESGRKIARWGPTNGWRLDLRCWSMSRNLAIGNLSRIVSPGRRMEVV